MKLIFLDFDGVLTTPATGFRYAAAQPVEYLNQLTERTGAKIVVTSTWRLSGLASVRKTLKQWGITGEVINITPDLTKRSKMIFTAVARGEEILTYLQTLPEQPDSFVIIDDDMDMWPFQHRLIQTDYQCGFSPKNLGMALTLLGEIP